MECFKMKNRLKVFKKEKKKKQQRGSGLDEASICPSDLFTASKVSWSRREHDFTVASSQGGQSLTAGSRPDQTDQPQLLVLLWL